MSPRQLFEHFRGDYQTHDIGWSEEQASTVLQTWQRRFVQVSLDKDKAECPEATGSSPPFRSTLSLQLAQEALPENASQQIHAFSPTTLDDILHAFSEVSTARVVGGYLLMVGPALAPSSTSTQHPPWKPLSETVPFLPTAGLCLRNHATVGLCPVSGCCGPCWGVAGGPCSGLWPWALLPAWHHLQCCHYSGTPGLQAWLGAITRLHSSSSCSPLCPSRSYPSWHWALVWMTFSYWLMPSQKLLLVPLSR